MTRLNLIKYVGGKSYILKWLYKHFVCYNYTYHTFVDIFGGSGTVTLNKTPSVKEILNDIDPIIYTTFHHVKHNTRLFGLLNQIECNRETFEKYKLIYTGLKEEGIFSEQLALATIVVSRMSRGGLRKDFSSSTRLRGGRIEEVNSWENFKLTFPQIRDRLQTIQLYQRSYAELIPELDSKTTLFYADPPYHPSTVKSKTYDYLMSEEQHLDFLALVKQSSGKFVISGYDNEVYRKELKEWNCFKKDIASHAGQTKVKARKVEVIWKNF